MNTPQSLPHGFSIIHNSQGFNIFLMKKNHFGISDCVAEISKCKDGTWLFGFKTAYDEETDSDWEAAATGLTKEEALAKLTAYATSMPN